MGYEQQCLPERFWQGQTSYFWALHNPLGYNSWVIEVATVGGGTNLLETGKELKSVQKKEKLEGGFYREPVQCQT